ncbi:MAG: NADH:flavin oxidoreductase/NADH oxidase [Castellaniella sp.]
MPNLFDPISLGKLALPNRIMISPMCQYSASDGNAGAWHYAHLGGLALSGAGLLCLEATAVSPEGRITPGCLGLWSDENEAAMRPVLDTLRKVSPIALAIQLAHAGRKAASASPWEGGGLLAPQEGGWQTIAPSALAHGAREAAPQAMSLDDIARVREDFAAAARRAVRLGFQAIEVHGAHGYLLHQFMSPIANARNDAYGGSLENRIRLALEVFDAVRNAVPADIPVGMRVSATDWYDDGPCWDLEQTIVLAHALKAAGADWIDVSSGGVTPLQKISVGPGYQVPFAQAVRAATGLTTMAVGLITEARQAQAIIEEGQADMVALGRAMLYNPRWPWHAAAELGARVDGARQYWRGLPSGTPRIFGDTIYGQR